MGHPRKFPVHFPVSAFRDEYSCQVKGIIWKPGIEPRLAACKACCSPLLYNF